VNGNEDDIFSETPDHADHAGRIPIAASNRHSSSNAARTRSKADLALPTFTNVFRDVKSVPGRSTASTSALTSAEGGNQASELFECLVPNFPRNLRELFLK
jgi:hypothetical protein